VCGVVRADGLPGSPAFLHGEDEEIGQGTYLHIPVVQITRFVPGSEDGWQTHCGPSRLAMPAAAHAP
jgi:hypothetical protein